MSWRLPRPAVGGLLAVVAAGAALRLVGLERTSFWLDEAYGVDVARQPLAWLVAGHVGDAHTPPLYYLLLHLWMRGGDSDAWLRGLSVLLSVAVLGVAACWLARRFGAGRALLGTALLAISPFQVYFAQEARMYPLATLLALAVFALEERAAGDGRTRTQLGLVVVGAAGLYTHYYLAFVLLGSVLVRAARLVRGRGGADSWRRLVLVHLAIGALCLPWVVVVAGLAASGGQQFHQTLVGIPAYAWFRFLAGYAVVPPTVAVKADPLGEFLAAWPWLVVVFGLGLAGLVGLWRRRGAGVDDPGAETVRHALGVVAVVFVVPFVVSLAVPMYGERYLGIVQPLVFLVLVAGLLGLGGRRGVIAVGALVAVSLAGTALWTLGSGGGREEWRSAVARIEANAAPRDVVVLDPWFNGWPVRRYLRRTDLDVRTAQADDPLPELGECRSSGLAPGHSLWVVLSRSPRDPDAWLAALAPCAVVRDSVTYPAGVGITVLRLDAAEASRVSPR